MSRGASSSLCGCHSPVGGRTCAPVVGVEAPRSVCKLWWEVGRIGILPWESSCWVFLHRSSVGLPATSCGGSETHCYWDGSRPFFHCGDAGDRPGCLQVLCLQCHQRGLVGTDLLKSGTDWDSLGWAPGPAVGTGARTPALPPRVTKPTAANLDLPLPQEHQYRLRALGGASAWEQLSCWEMAHRLRFQPHLSMWATMSVPVGSQSSYRQRALSTVNTPGTKLLWRDPSPPFACAGIHPGCRLVGFHF